MIVPRFVPRHFCKNPRSTAFTLCGAKIKIALRGLSNFSVVRSRVTCLRCKAMIRSMEEARHRALAILALLDHTRPQEDETA